jgi:ribonuclease HI
MATPQNSRRPSPWYRISPLHKRGVLELLHHRVTLGFPTFFVKVRAHRGEPYNEAADRIAPHQTRWRPTAKRGYKPSRTK